MTSYKKCGMTYYPLKIQAYKSRAAVFVVIAALIRKKKIYDVFLAFGRADGGSPPTRGHAKLGHKILK